MATSFLQYTEDSSLPDGYQLWAVLNVLSQVLISNHHSQNFSLNRYVQTKGPFSAGFISF